MGWARRQHAHRHPGHQRPGDIPARRWARSNPLANLRFGDELPQGRRDLQGKYLGATETMCLTAHRGALFAATGCWMDVPYGQAKGNDPWTGPCVLRKDSATGAAVHEDHAHRNLLDECIVKCFCNLPACLGRLLLGTLRLKWI